MKSITEPKRDTEISASCDVLVAGGGIAGVSAAIAAAQNGKDVILLEREYALGGMATLGLIAIYLPLCDGEGKQVVFGLGEELLRESIKYEIEANAPMAWLENGTREEKKRQRFAVQFNPQLFALQMERMLVALGVRIMYGSLAADVVQEDGRICAVIIENKSGRSAIAVDSVIDATGDADICRLSGAETILNANGNGLASWYYYNDGNRVALKMFGLADLPPKNSAAKDEDAYALAKVESLDNSFRFSGVNGEELSRAVITAHEKMFADILEQNKANKRYVPVTMSTIPLVRMSRRIAGAYTLDESEDHKRADDSIGMTGDWRKRGPIFEIPYRTLYTPTIKNLLTAGRDISVTDTMWDITRVIPPCAVTGEAAGMAAALCSDFPNLDVELLQKKLRSRKIRLHIDELEY